MNTVIVDKPFPKGTVELATDTIYQLPPAGLDIDLRHFVKKGTGAKPKFAYTGPRGQAALKVPASSFASTSDIDFQLGTYNYAVASHGAFSGVNGEIFGGGAANITAADGDNVFTNWFLRSQFALYGWYVGGVNVVTKTAKGVVKSFTQERSKKLTLNNCGADHGPTVESTIRVHATDEVNINGGTWKNLDGLKAILRIHDANLATVTGTPEMPSTWFGDFDLGPLDPLSGSEAACNLPPGPEREYRDAQRLVKLIIKGAAFTGGFFHIASGIVDAQISNTAFSATKGGALFNITYPYMKRPLSKMQFTGCPLAYNGTNNDHGRVFNSETGAKLIRIAPTKFNGNAYAH